MYASAFLTALQKDFSREGLFRKHIFNSVSFRNISRKQFFKKKTNENSVSVQYSAKQKLSY